MKKAAQYEREKNFLQAVKCYQNVISRKSSKKKDKKKANEKIEKLYLCMDIDGESSRKIGEMYHFGKEAKEDYAQARKWYEKAVTKDEKIAYQALGMLYEDGLGVEKDYKIASDYYKKSFERGNLKALDDFNQVRMKHNLKIKTTSETKYDESLELTATLPVQHSSHLNEHEIKPPGVELSQKIKNKGVARNKILALIEEKKDLSQLDTDGETHLHQFAKSAYLKHSARLVNINAGLKEIKDKIGKTPLEYINNIQREKITRLGTKEMELISNLYKQPWDVVVKNITAKQMKFDEAKTAEELKIACKDKYIKPLFDFAQLAALGHHRLSGRQKFQNNPQADEYDSDDDCDENFSSNHYFSVIIDPDSDNVCAIAHWGNDGQSGKGALGVHISGKYTQNQIFVAGKREGNEVMGTFIHELTHFVILETFGNYKPYSEGDQQHRKEFTEIADELEKYVGLPEVLRGAFGEYYKKNDQVHGELIVRIPQMILSQGWVKGFKECQNEKSIIKLLSYYENVFLDAVIKHTKKLENIAMGGWPKHLFFKTATQSCNLQSSSTLAEDKEGIRDRISENIVENSVQQRKNEITDSCQKVGMGIGVTTGTGVSYCWLVNPIFRVLCPLIGGLGGAGLGRATGKFIANYTEKDIRKGFELEKKLEQHQKESEARQKRWDAREEELKAQLAATNKGKNPEIQSIPSPFMGIELSPSNGVGLFKQLSLLRKKELESNKDPVTSAEKELKYSEIKQEPKDDNQHAPILMETTNKNQRTSLKRKEMDSPHNQSGLFGNHKSDVYSSQGQTKFQKL